MHTYVPLRLSLTFVIIDIQLNATKTNAYTPVTAHAQVLDTAQAYICTPHCPGCSPRDSKTSISWTHSVSIFLATKHSWTQLLITTLGSSLSPCGTDISLSPCGTDISDDISDLGFALSGIRSRAIRWLPT